MVKTNVDNVRETSRYDALSITFEDRIRLSYNTQLAKSRIVIVYMVLVWLTIGFMVASHIGMLVFYHTCDGFFSGQELLSKIWSEITYATGGFAVSFVVFFFVGSLHMSQTVNIIEPPAQRDKRFDKVLSDLKEFD